MCCCAVASIPPPEQVTPDTPLRLEIAAAIAFPDGSMTAAGLRRDAARGRLVIERIAGKYFTTLANIERMRELCRVEAKARTSGIAASGLRGLVILDHGREISTGASESDISAAEEVLADHIGKKHRPDFGQGHPSQILIADALSEYGEKHAPATCRPDLIGGAISKLSSAPVQSHP